MKTTRWINPVAPAPSAEHAPSQGRARRAGPLRLGLLDNTKDNAALLLQAIAERVRREMAVEVILRRKDNPATGAPPEMLDELAHEADCVLTAMAD